MNPDLLILHLVNGWCGSPLLDSLALFADRMNILKGGVTLAAFWYFWFQGTDQTRTRNRQIIVLTMLAMCLAIFGSRILAATLPFRARPMYTAGIGYHPSSIAAEMDLENWSSFPSDHAAMWFALSFGIWLMSRRVGYFAMLFSAVWICLPRLYLGIHYPSDLLAGAVFGVACTRTLMNPAMSRLTEPVLRLERQHTAWFYATAFLLTYEAASIFDDARRVLRIMHHLRHTSVNIELSVILVAGFVSIIAAMKLLSRMDRQS